jgi:predicted nucleotidyltransferase
LEVIEGVEIDYTSNEIQGVLAGIISGNGNYAERVLGEHKLLEGPENSSLAPLVERALSRKMFRHYQGFASNQMKEVEEKETVTAKKVLYVLRTALTGTHLMKSGRLVVDVTKLLDQYGYKDAAELIAAKRAGERAPLQPLVVLKWKNELRRAFTLLDEARDGSPLPEEAPNRAELEAWMLELRRKLW